MERFNPVLTQDAKERTSNQWQFTQYDILGRVVRTGILTNTNNRSSLQELFSPLTPNGGIDFTTEATPPLGVGGLFSADDIQTENYYDTYGSWRPANQAYVAQSGYGSNFGNATGLLTGKQVRYLENNSFLASSFYYDDKARVVQTFTQNLYGQTERTDMEYNFAGQVLKTRKVKKNQAGTATTQLKSYTYDHVGRKTTYQLNIGNINESIANYEYDEIGRMKRKVFLPNGNFTTGGTKNYIIRPTPDGVVSQSNTQDIARQAIILNPNTEIKPQNVGTYLARIDPNATGSTSINGLQKVDYSWHIRGGLRGINLDNSLNPIPNSTEGDLFSYKLDYETITPTTSGYFDGNIAKQTWHNGTVQRSYSYNYDVANRLKSATYSGVNGEDYSIPNMNYDANGNITNLQRKGKLGNGWGLIDNLTYTRTGNRLSQITDNIGGNHEVDFVQRGGANYTYYNDGSLKSDANEQIQNIVYDSFLGQPTQVQLTDGTINHYYDGSGQLLKNVYSNGEYWEFSNEFIYKNGVLYQANDDEGRILYQNGQYVYEFDYKDHLGNTRLSFRANNGQLEKVAETSFDPWGVVLNGIGQQNTTKNRWEMQGKEKESTFGLNRLAFGARTYNPTTVVWDNIDLLSEKYYGISPYVYVLNRPTVAIDPDGRRVYFVGGANNDRDGWNYINRWRNSFANAGINNFVRVNASHGKSGDVMFTNSYRNSGTEYEYRMRKEPGEAMYREYTGRELPVNNAMINSTVKLYKQQLKDNPLQDGEQFNLAGYSYGSVLQAQAALKLANDGVVVDNLVLIGSPISDDSKLYKQLSENKNIRNIIRMDIPNDHFSNPNSLIDDMKGLWQNRNNNGAHFDLARPGTDADKRIQETVDKIKKEGVKN